MRTCDVQICMSSYVIICRSPVTCGRVTNRPSMCPRETVFFFPVAVLQPKILCMLSSSEPSWYLTQRKRFLSFGVPIYGIVPPYRTTLMTQPRSWCFFSFYTNANLRRQQFPDFRGANTDNTLGSYIRYIINLQVLIAVDLLHLLRLCFGFRSAPMSLSISISISAVSLDG